MSKKSDQINNSYFIKNEFKQKSGAYKAPLPRKMQRTTSRGRSGKVYHYTAEEIFLYQVRKCAQCLQMATKVKI